MTQDDVAAWAPPREPAWRRIARISFWALIGLAVAALAASIVMLFAITRVYSVSTPTMERTVPAGDRVFLAPGSAIRRGDVVVLRVPVRVSHASTVFVKRVIGLPGDHVACCDSRGRVMVNGKSLDESYLYPGDPPSRSTFSVTLAPGQIWVMGDQRTISVDSRTWGPVPLSGVVGRVVLVNHGSSFSALRTPPTFVTDGLAPPDTRADAYQVLALLIAGSVLMLLVLGVTGITRFMVGQRSSRRGPPPPPAEPALAGAAPPSGVAPPAEAALHAGPAEAPGAEPAPSTEAVPGVGAITSAESAPSAPAGGVGVVEDSSTPPGAAQA